MRILAPEECKYPRLVGDPALLTGPVERAPSLFNRTGPKSRRLVASSEIDGNFISVWLNRPGMDDALIVDLHTHTQYSDGSSMQEMAAAAARAGLSGLGFTDHCVTYDDPFGRSERTDFDETFRSRRKELKDLRPRAEVELYDGAEVNYDPSHESEIQAFLSEADFDYVIGSVHYAGSYDLMHPDVIRDSPRETRREAVAKYFDWQEQLIESELFDVVGHLDLPIRERSLRSVVRESDYRRLANALKRSRTVPELNLGAFDGTIETIHPCAEFVHHFDACTLGSDAHAPAQIPDRIGELAPLLDQLDVAVLGAEDLLNRQSGQ